MDNFLIDIAFKFSGIKLIESVKYSQLFSG
jgi:hypothetical protein